MGQPQHSKPRPFWFSYQPPHQTKYPYPKSTLFGELFSGMKKNELNHLQPSVYVFSFSQPLLIRIHSCILAFLGEKQAIKKLSRDQQLYRNDLQTALFTYLINKYYCVLCTNLCDNIWEYNCGPGRQVCCLYEAYNQERTKHFLTELLKQKKTYQKAWTFQK